MKDQDLADRMKIDHKELKNQLLGIVNGIDTYVFDSIDKEVTALGFIPTEK